MRAPRFLAALLILACGFIAGLVLTGRMRAVTTEAAPAASQTQVARPSPAQTQLPIPAGLPDFSGVAWRTVVGLANISSRLVIARQNSALADVPFCGCFFGDDSDRYGLQRD